MKTIDAHWDNEVLGVKSAELRCDLNDDFSTVVRAIEKSESDYEYLAVKVPSQMQEIVQSLPSLGFKFIETLMSVERTTDSKMVDERLVKRCRTLAVEKANLEQTNFVQEQIMKGIFSTDRISVDNNFGPVVGARRYWNWIQSEISLGADIYIVSLSNSTPLGFFTLRVGSDSIAHSVLSGVFDTQQTPGVGLLLLLLILIKSEDLGAKKILSAISSNNLPVVRTHVQLGFEIREMNYVFVRLSKRN